MTILSIDSVTFDKKVTHIVQGRLRQFTVLIQFDSLYLFPTRLSLWKQSLDIECKVAYFCVKIMSCSSSLFFPPGREESGANDERLAGSGKQSSV